MVLLKAVEYLLLQFFVLLFGLSGQIQGVQVKLELIKPTYKHIRPQVK